MNDEKCRDVAMSAEMARNFLMMKRIMLGLTKDQVLGVLQREALNLAEQGSTWNKEVG